MLSLLGAAKPAVLPDWFHKLADNAQNPTGRERATPKTQRDMREQPPKPDGM
ncbi:hypothetical protein GCM10010523_19220 [Paenarthrobacter ilicis]